MDIKNLKYFDLEHWPDSNLDHHDKLQTRFCLSEDGTGLLMSICNPACCPARIATFFAPCDPVNPPGLRLQPRGSHSDSCLCCCCSTVSWPPPQALMDWAGLP